MVCFLGFAYDPDNLDKLEVSKNLLRKSHVFGSAYGLDTGEQQRVAARGESSSRSHFLALECNWETPAMTATKS